MINIVDHGASSDLSDLSSSACFYCHFSISHGRRSQAQIIINTRIFAHLRRDLEVSDSQLGVGCDFIASVFMQQFMSEQLLFAESKKTGQRTGSYFLLQ